MPGTKPTKKDLARMKVMNELGLSPTSIAKRMGKSHNTVLKYFRSKVYNDPDINKLVDIIREKEIEDLYLLGGKARARLHELIDEGNTKVIETLAVMDRSFQQRRLLEGRSTMNISSLAAIIQAAHERAKRSNRRKRGARKNRGAGGREPLVYPDQRFT